MGSEMCIRDRLYFVPQENIEKNVAAALEGIYDRYLCGMFVSSIDWQLEQTQPADILDIAITYKNEQTLSEIAKIGMQPRTYTKDVLKTQIEQAVKSGAESLTLLFVSEGADKERLEQDTKDIVNGEAAICEYYLARTVYKVYVFADYAQLTVEFSYQEDKAPAEDIPFVSDMQEAVMETLAQWQTGKEPVAVMMETEDPTGAAQTILNAADANNVLFPYVSDLFQYASSGEGTCIIEMAHKMDMDAALLEQNRQALQDAVTVLAAAIEAACDTDEERQQMLFDELVRRVEYDREISEAGEQTQQMRINRSAYGALVTGKTVCSGYARAYKAVCDELRLPCWVVRGYHKDTAHEWNAVLLHGQVYYVDATFADTGGGSRYSLFTESEMVSWGYEIEEGYILPQAFLGT